MTLLSVESVGKRFGGITALHDVSFAVADGEILGLMGANGAGKTTMMALIAGNLRPTTGRIRLNGRAIQGQGAARVNRLGIARTFQIVRPFTGLSVRQNVVTAALYGRAQLRDRGQADDRAQAILDKLDLAGRAELPAGSLTLAGRKRLEIARALATQPRLLLLDEVMAGLTATEVAQAMAILRRLRDEDGLTLIVIEHVMRALMHLSDRIVVLHHGEKIMEGTPDQVAHDPRVIDVYFGANPHGQKAEAAP